MLAGMAVTLADPSGIFGTLKEGFAGASALLTAKKDAGANAIAKAIAADFDTPEGRTVARDASRAAEQDEPAAPHRPPYPRTESHAP